MNLRDFGMEFNGSVKWIVSPKQWLKSVTQRDSFTTVNTSLEIFLVH